MSSSKISPFSFIKIIIYVLIIGCSLLSWRIYGQLNNSLSNNNQWQSTKMKLEKQVNGTFEYFYWRQALAHEKLNLGAWYGYQELISQHPLHTKQVDIDIFLPQNSYVDIIYNKNPDSYYTFRFSSNQFFPSALINQKDTGEFLSVLPLNLPLLHTYKWHHLTLDFDSTKGLVNLYTDHKFSNSYSINVESKPVFVGLRGSHQNSYVDNLFIKDTSGRIVFEDNFSYHDSRWIFKIFIIIIFFYSIYFFNRQSHFKTILILSHFLFLLIVTTGYLHYFYVDRYPNPTSLWSHIQNRFRSVGDINELTFSQKMNQEILDSVIDDDRDRILFLGTSQTWGAGAAKVDETYVSVLEKNIASFSQSKYQFINAGISGSSSTEILGFYKEFWIKLNPKIVLVDLSSNDTDAIVFTKNLKEIIDLNKTKGITTVFLLEANSIDSPDYGGMPLHEPMRSLASSENIRLIDIHEYLNQMRTYGNLWWDKVHPTTFGHRLLGEYIYEQIRDLF